LSEQAKSTGLVRNLTSFVARDPQQENPADTRQDGQCNPLRPVIAVVARQSLASASAEQSEVAKGIVSAYGAQFVKAIVPRDASFPRA
jgi:hypothetical protein